MDCPSRSGPDLAEAYVAGTLPEAEQDAYEQHFFGCSMCLAQVQTLQELADRLRQQPAPVVLHRPPAPGWTSGPWLGLALAASLVAAFGWWWQGGVNRPPAPAIATGSGPARHRPRRRIRRRRPRRCRPTPRSHKRQSRRRAATPSSPSSR